MNLLSLLGLVVLGVGIALLLCCVGCSVFAALIESRGKDGL